MNFFSAEESRLNGIFIIKMSYMVVGDSMLTGISEKGLSKKHHVSVTSFSGGTSEKIILMLY